MNYEKITLKLCKFIKKQVESSGAKGVVLGLSGGIDSALVLKLCVMAFKKSDFEILALMLPTSSSNKENLSDAISLCELFNVKYKIIEIDKILNAFAQKCEDLNALRKGNLAARIRMCLLYDYSAKYNFLVAGTSNKSERMLGYGTIYGDLACAFNPLARLYKSEVFKLSEYLALPKNFITKLPSADLVENQSDEADLGFSYNLIDQGLKALEKRDKKVLESLPKELISMIKFRKNKNKFKLKMPKIIKEKK